jgi:site-specific DNA-methyltransferase (adenine-specific)
VTPYYQDDWVTIYHGDCRDFTVSGDLMVTDPPYGLDYSSGRRRLPSTVVSCVGDSDVSLRDEAIQRWGGKPALVFGTWKRPTPAGTKAMLVWDQGPALGMGDLSIPWKPSWQAIYVLGGPWPGGRDSGAVIPCPPIQSQASFGRVHPFEKPVPLLRALIERCPGGTVFDPFMGSGTTLRAAVDLGRRAIGIEIEERYCALAVKRLAQGALALADNPPINTDSHD